jgi:hypothetical protein
MVIMKRCRITPSLSLAAMLWSGALTTGAFAYDGLIAFGNPSWALITYSDAPGAPQPLPANAAGSFYFGLLISSNATGPFTFTGVYGTNSASAGHINFYTAWQTGWPSETWMFYELAGWSASLGTTFDPAWLSGNFSGRFGYFGMSSVGGGLAGGGCPWCTSPALSLFGGTRLTGLNLLLVNPLILNPDFGFGVQIDKFGFTFSWATNGSVVVEAATDLSNPVWSPLQTITVTNGSADFSDPQWTHYPARFYRLRSP